MVVSGVESSNSQKKNYSKQGRLNLKDESDKYCQAAHRLDVLASGNAFGDIFAVEVYYYKKCYSGFTYT